MIYSNLFCAIDVETTGLDPEKHEIVQIAIQPLDHNFNILADVAPFYLDILPTRPENWQAWGECDPAKRLEQLQLTGIDPNKAKELLEDWFMRLQLIQNRFIIPIGHNWFNFDKLVIKKWLGATVFDSYFHYNARDTMLIASWINDFSAYRFAVRKPFKSVSLNELCKFFKIQNVNAHDALADALATAQVFKALLGMNLAG